MNPVVAKIVVVVAVCGFAVLSGKVLRKSAEEKEKKKRQQKLKEGKAEDASILNEDHCNVVEKKVVYSPPPRPPSWEGPFFPPPLPAEADNSVQHDKDNTDEATTVFLHRPASLLINSVVVDDEVPSHGVGGGDDVGIPVLLDLSINETVFSLLFGKATTIDGSSAPRSDSEWLPPLPGFTELPVTSRNGEEAKGGEAGTYISQEKDGKDNTLKTISLETPIPMQKFMVDGGEYKGEGDDKGEEGSRGGTKGVHFIEHTYRECPAGPADADNEVLLTLAAADKDPRPYFPLVDAELGSTSDDAIPLSHVDPSWGRDSVANLWGVESLLLEEECLEGDVVAESNIVAESAFVGVHKNIIISTTGIDELPDECLSVIFAKVGGNARDCVFWERLGRVPEANPLLRLTRVCQRWRRHVETMVQYLRLEGPQHTVVPSGRNRGRPRQQPRPERVWEWPEPGGSAQTGPRDLQTPQRTIGEALCEALPRFPNLVELEVRRCYVAGWHDLFVSLGQYTKGLTTLVIAHAPAFPGWESLGESQLVALAEGCPGLRSLVIEHTVSRSVKALPSLILFHLPQLSTFRLVGARSISVLPPYLFSHPRLYQLQLALLPALRSLPDPIPLSYSLSELRIESMKQLASLPDSFCFLPVLRKLAVIACPLLETLPTLPPSLEELLVESCTDLSSLPNPISAGPVQALSSLTLCDLPSLLQLPSLGSLTSLRRFRLSNLRCLNDNIGPLSSEVAEEVTVEGCRLRYLPKKLQQVPGLRKLRWRRCGLAFVPPSICELVWLRKLDIGDNPLVLSLPVTIGQMPRLERLTIDGCTGMRCLPDTMLNLKSLRVLSVKGCNLDQRILRALQAKGVRITGL